MKNFILVLVLLFSLNVSGQYFSGDVINGYGTITYEDGSAYSGEWKDGTNSGQGTYIYANGDTYVGEWKDNMPTVGKVYDKDGNIIKIRPPLVFSKENAEHLLATLEKVLNKIEVPAA